MPPTSDIVCWMKGCPYKLDPKDVGENADSKMGESRTAKENTW